MLVEIHYTPSGQRSELRLPSPEPAEPEDTVAALIHERWSVETGLEASPGDPNRATIIAWLRHISRLDMARSLTLPPLELTTEVPPMSAEATQPVPHRPLPNGASAATSRSPQSVQPQPVPRRRRRGTAVRPRHS